MDFLASLQSEIAAKKKKMAEVAGDKTFVRAADLEARRQQEYEEEQRKLEEKRKQTKRKEHDQRTQGSKSDSETESSKQVEPDVLKIPAKDVIRNLRRRGEPIRLFGESDEERVVRLRALEAAQPEIDGQLNEFRQQISNLDSALDVEALKRKAEEDEEVSEKDDDEGRKRRKTMETLLTEHITADMFERDRDKLYALTHDYFKRLLMEWEDDLNAREEHVKRSMQGKIETVTMMQAHEYMKPFFKLLKTKSMPDDVMVNLALICQYMQEREYVKANDTYYLLSIGNAPWPIGVTMVGIHERSAREKIFSHQVAHVLNDEKTRKWIQSMKRLMTFCQNKYLPDDLAKTAGWIKK